MKMHLMTVLGVAATLLVGCEDGVVGERKVHDEWVYVQGTVTDAESSLPLTGVTVQITERMEEPEVTESNGHYSIRAGLGHPRGTVEFAKDGYQPHHVALPGPAVEDTARADIWILSVSLVRVP